MDPLLFDPSDFTLVSPGTGINQLLAQGLPTLLGEWGAEAVTGSGKFAVEQWTNQENRPTVSTISTIVGISAHRP